MDKKNKIIAKYALDFIGGKPEVFEYKNDDGTKSIDIMTCRNSQYSGSIVVSTIGLTDTPIGLSVNDKDLRVELIAVADRDCECLENIVASTAFCIMDYNSAQPGVIIENAYGDYISYATAKHAVLISPPYWEKYKAMECADCAVAWLYMLPITDEEMSYIDENGIEAFEALMEEKDIDTSDFGRDSAV